MQCFGCTLAALSAVILCTTSLQDVKKVDHVYGAAFADYPMCLYLVFYAVGPHTLRDSWQASRHFWQGQLLQSQCLQTAQGVLFRALQGGRSAPEWLAKDREELWQCCSLPKRSEKGQTHQHPSPLLPPEYLLWHCHQNTTQRPVSEEKGMQVHPPCTH